MNNLDKYNHVRYLAGLITKYFKVRMHLRKAIEIIDSCNTTNGTTNYEVDSGILKVLSTKYAVIETGLIEELKSMPNSEGFKEKEVGFEIKRVYRVQELLEQGHSEKEALKILEKEGDNWSRPLN